MSMPVPVVTLTLTDLGLTTGIKSNLPWQWRRDADCHTGESAHYEQELFPARHARSVLYNSRRSARRRPASIGRSLLLSTQPYLNTEPWSESVGNNQELSEDEKECLA